MVHTVDVFLSYENMKHFKKRSLYLTLHLVTTSCLIPSTAEAQVSPNGTTSTTVNQVGNDFTIEQGDRVVNNLYVRRAKPRSTIKEIRGKN